MYFSRIGGGPLYPPFPITCRFWLFLQLGINQYCIFSKRPPPTSKKSRYNHKISKFQGVAPQYSAFFHYWGGPTPLISRQVGFCANIPKKTLLQPQRIKISDCFPQYFAFFFILGGSHPLISRQVGFFKRDHDLSWYKRRKKPPPPLTIIQLKSENGLTNSIGGGGALPPKGGRVDPLMFSILSTKNSGNKIKQFRKHISAIFCVGPKSSPS